MKKLILSLALLLSISLSYSQTTDIICKSCDNTSGSYIIGNDGSAAVTYFQGLLVKPSRGADYAIPAPYTYWFAGSLVYFRLPDGDIKSIRISGTKFRTRARMQDFLQSCICSGGRTKVDDNILYVSKGGENETAVKGLRDHPYKDPWYAVAHADSGSIVIVGPGTYEIGDTLTGADFEWNATGDTYSLLKNGVDIHFEAGAKLLNSSTVNNYLWYAEPDSNEYIVQNVTGDLEILYGPNGKFLFYTLDNPTAHVEFSIECKKITYLYYAFLIRSSVDEFHLKVDEVEAIGLTTYGNGCAFIFTNAANTSEDVLIRHANITADVQNVRVNCESASSDAGTLVAMRNTYESQLSIKFGNVTGYWSGPGLLATIGGFGANNIRSSLNISVDNVNIVDPAIRDSIYTGFTYGAITQACFNQTVDSTSVSCLVQLYNQNNLLGNYDNIVFIEIGNISGDISAGIFANFRNTATTIRNDIQLVVGNINTTNNYPCVFVDPRNGGAFPTCSFGVRVIGTARSNGVPILTAAYGTGEMGIDFEGRFESTTDSLPTMMYHENWTNPISLRNCILKSGSTTGAIIPRVDGNAFAINISNSATNNIVQHPDVSYLVEPLILDANVK
jgi:hypothetical protein